MRSTVQTTVWEAGLANLAAVARMLEHTSAAEPSSLSRNQSGSSMSRSYTSSFWNLNLAFGAL